MSIVNLFEEELERKLKELGLDINDISSYETSNEKWLILYTNNGRKIYIKDPYLVTLSKVKTNEEILVDFFFSNIRKSKTYFSSIIHKY